jgi:DNA-binding GntR family transcriptional regulator
MVEIEHRQGARVRRLTRREIENLYDVREILEGYAASRAATNSDDAAFRKGITQLKERFKKEFDGSPQSYMDYNRKFSFVHCKAQWKCGSDSTDLRTPCSDFHVAAISHHRSFLH